MISLSHATQLGNKSYCVGPNLEREKKDNKGHEFPWNFYSAYCQLVISVIYGLYIVHDSLESMFLLVGFIQMSIWIYER